MAMGSDRRKGCGMALGQGLADVSRKDLRLREIPTSQH